MEHGPSPSADKLLVKPQEPAEVGVRDRTAQPQQKPATTPPVTQLLHLFGLSALAFAQPVLGRLGGNSPYLEMERFGSATLWIMLGIILTGVPMLLFTVVQVASAMNARVGKAVYSVFVFVLITLLIQLFMNWTSAYFALKSQGIPDVALLFVSSILGLLFVVVYRRRETVSQCVTFASLSALAVPVSFVTSSQMQAFLYPKAGPAHVVTSRCENPVPVVMIIFDGLNGMALLDERLELDAVRYPGFARLAASSTWYRNTSTVHYRTDNAVPAILTGCIPPDNLLPTEESYPDNLFRRIYDSEQYDLTVFEPFTRLCPAEISPEPDPVDLVSQQLSLISTLVLVYLDNTLPDEFSYVDAITPLPWFGLRDKPLFNEETSIGLVGYGWDTQRKHQLEHFRKCLVPSEKPTFRFLHVVLPHYPWCYLPSGKSYGNLRAVDIPVGAHGALGEDWGPDELASDQAWQRYLLQLGFADTYLGQILDQLESEKLLDESLMIVVADHGAAFKANTSRRVPTADTLEDLMPVPLFVKLPGQQSGSVSDRNVETIDVFPTIADVLQMSPDISVDGSSLIDERQPSRLRKHLVGVGGPVIVEPDFPKRFDYARRATQRFGSGNSDKLITSLNVLPELIGQSILDLSISDQPGVNLEVYTGIDGRVTATDSFVPCFFNGIVLNNKTTLPVFLAVAVNGKICATTRTFRDPLVDHCWAAMSPESAFQIGDNDISVFEVQTVSEQVVLKKCHVEKI